MTGLRGRTGHETGRLSSLYEKKVRCEIISNSFECNHGNRIIAYIFLKVILCSRTKNLINVCPSFLAGLTDITSSCAIK